jgi:hypothetical protein
MAYAVTFNDGSPLLLVADNSLDTTRSVTFIGRNYQGYGFYQNQNLVTLLTNSASPNNARPLNPLQGQLWYDATNQKLNIYDPDVGFNEGWMHAGGATVGYSPPSGAAVGDLWYDLNSQTLNLYSENDYISIPTYPRNRPTGWVQALNTVVDNNASPVGQQVTLLANFGNVVGALSNSSFTAGEFDSTYTFPLAETNSYDIVQGLNIIGYIQSTGGLIINQSSVPLTATSDGVAGQIAYDANYIYVCVAPNSWKRTGLSGF